MLQDSIFHTNQAHVVNLMAPSTETHTCALCPLYSNSPQLSTLLPIFCYPRSCLPIEQLRGEVQKWTSVCVQVYTSRIQRHRLRADEEQIRTRKLEVLKLANLPADVSSFRPDFSCIFLCCETLPRRHIPAARRRVPASRISARILR